MNSRTHNRCSNWFASTGLPVVVVAALLSHGVFAAQSPTAYLNATRYNNVGQVTGTIQPDPDGAGPLSYPATRNTYNNKGQLTKTESGELGQWYDETVLPVSWSDFAVHSTVAYTYDTAGRQRTVETLDRYNNPLTLTQYSYTHYDQVQCKAVRMNPAAFTSLPSSACTLGAEGSQGSDRVTRYEYNMRQQVERESRAVGTPLAQVYRGNHYDSAGRLSGLTDANGNYTELRYNAQYRLERRVHPSKTQAGALNESDYNQYTYDNNGNVIQERKRNGTLITNTYDKLNRLTLKDRPGTANDVYYSYDLRGLNLYARFNSPSGPGITNTFDGFGNLMTSTNHMSGVSRTLIYRYDNNGNRIQITHPDNVYFGYTFDGINRVNGVTENANSSLLTLTYHPSGQRHKIIRPPNSAVTTYNFDDVSRLQSIQQDFNGTADDLTNSFTYNPANQVTSLSLSNELFHYQGNANRRGSYSTNGLNQYTHIAGQPFSYDTNGNLTNDGSLIYAYDEENRLTGTSGGATSSFKYDPLGRLATITINGTTTHFLYDGDALVAEYNSAGTLTRRYVHGDQVDEPWVQYNGAGIGYYRSFVFADHQGSIIAHANFMGMVTSHLTYDAYGIPGSTNIERFGYTGQIWFKELGLFHYKARMYAPKLGRFLQTDPVGYADQMNLYAYVHNDPLNATDPTGKSTVYGGTSAPAMRAVQDACGGANNACVQQVSSDMLKAGAVAATLVVPDAMDIVVAGVVAKAAIGAKASKVASDVTQAYKRPSGATTKAQRASVQNKPCVDCGATTSRQVADHKTPLVKEYYETGKIDKANMRNVDSVQPQCPTCSARQGAEMSRYSRRKREELGL